MRPIQRSAGSRSRVSESTRCKMLGSLTSGSTFAFRVLDAERASACCRRRSPSAGRPRASSFDVGQAPPPTSISRRGCVRSGMRSALRGRVISPFASRRMGAMSSPRSRSRSMLSIEQTRRSRGSSTASRNPSASQATTGARVTLNTPSGAWAGASRMRQLARHRVRSPARSSRPPDPATGRGRRFLSRKIPVHGTAVVRSKARSSPRAPPR